MSNSDLQEFEHRFIPGASGRTLLLLHGTGGDEDDLLPLGRALEDKAALLSPRGRVLENGRPRFFWRLSEGVFDEEDVVYRAGELSNFIAQAAGTYGFDPKRVTAVGYSNGANIAGAILLLHPDVLCRAVLLRPMVPLLPTILPELRGVPVLVSAGNQDPIVPADNVRELVELLRRAGADVTVSFENAAHDLTDATLATARRWLTEKAV